MPPSLSHSRRFDATGVQVTLPPLPDDCLTNAAAGHIDPNAFFPNPNRPLYLEIGSGKGTFLVQEAPHFPEVNWLGIEYAGEFFYYAADRVRRAGLTNVKMLHTDAAAFVHWRLPPRSVDVLHLYFPDPWPKRKHNRRRMIQDAFLEDCTRILKARGELRVATDHLDYWHWMEDHFARWTSAEAPFERLPFEKPLGAKEGELVGTNFERKYIAEGRTFNAAVLKLRS